MWFEVFRLPVGLAGITQSIAAGQGSGWGGIRTHGTVTRTAIFKTAAFVHSATHPDRPSVSAKRARF